MFLKLGQVYNECRYVFMKKKMTFMCPEYATILSVKWNR